MARSKKTQKEEPAMDETKMAAMKEEERRKLIADFNVNNDGKIWIDPDKIPTEDDVREAQKVFEDTAAALRDKNDYVIAKKEDALKVAKFMKEFNDNAFWTQRMFVGVLNFSDLLNEFINGFDEENPKDLSLEYAPVQYAYLLFENFAGFGYDGAKHMAEIWDDYVNVYDKLHELVDWYKAETTRIDSLRDVWALMEQGYYAKVTE